MTENRSKVIDFSYPHTITSLTFITSPPKFKINLEYDNEVFDKFIWFLIIFSLIHNLFIVQIINKLLMNSKYNNFNNYWNIIEIFFSQSFNDSYIKNILSMRLLLLDWIINCLILKEIYENSIYSLITQPIKLNSIETIEELADASTNGEIEILIKAGTNEYDIVKVTKILFYNLFYNL